MALFEKNTNKFIGEAGFISYNSYANRCEVGYNLLPEYWNKGYATEVTKALVKFAFDSLKVERIEALVIEFSHKSRWGSEKSLEWNRETEFFILCFYIVIPTLVIGAVIIGLILLLRSLIRSRSSWRKRK